MQLGKNNRPGRVQYFSVINSQIKISKHCLSSRTAVYSDSEVKFANSKHNFESVQEEVAEKFDSYINPLLLHKKKCIGHVKCEVNKNCYYQEIHQP